METVDKHEYGTLMNIDAKMEASGRDSGKNKGGSGKNKKEESGKKGSKKKEENVSSSAYGTLAIANDKALAPTVIKGKGGKGKKGFAAPAQGKAQEEAYGTLMGVGERITVLLLSFIAINACKFHLGEKMQASRR